MKLRTIGLVAFGLVSFSLVSFSRAPATSVMLFQGWSSAKGGWSGTPWRGHPYHRRGRELEGR
jgi:hypothetical protein